MPDADPLIELQVRASPAPRFKETRRRAAAFAGYIDRGRDGFTLTARLLALSRLEVDELIAIAITTCGWKHATATVNGRLLSKFDLAGALRCWRDRRDAPPRKQAKHCAWTPTPADKRTVPEVFRPPCRMRFETGLVRWADHAPGGLTDHAAMQAAMAAAGSSHPFAWCPAFDVGPALVQIRKLPASRQRTCERAQRKRQRVETAWQSTQAELSRRLQEARELEASATWLELAVERATSHGSASLSRDDWARLADETGLQDLRALPDVATMTELQRNRLIERLRELRVDDVE